MYVLYLLLVCLTSIIPRHTPPFVPFTAYLPCHAAPLVSVFVLLY